jgi:hypothetical protein
MERSYIWYDGKEEYTMSLIHEQQALEKQSDTGTDDVNDFYSFQERQEHQQPTSASSNTF